MIPLLRRHLYRSLKRCIYGQWPKHPPLEDGYTMLLPSPADMPFLLRFALEGLRHLRMPHCRRIIVISDGVASDHALRSIVAEYGDERIRFAPLSPIDNLLVNLPRSDGSANYRHFTQILRGVLAATTDAIYLHDADAFWLDEDGIECQYREFCDRGMHALGVTARIDPMFRDRGLIIPGTWELMYSRSWVRRRPPEEMKGGWYPLPDGEWRWFDTLLYAQYLDHASGKYGVMAKPPRLVHFYGTITEYRLWRKSSGPRPTEDKLFSLLLLSILAEAIPGSRRDIPLPRPREMARGLRDPSAPITYLGRPTAERYGRFRAHIEDLCSSPGFADDVARRIRDLIAPFDEHFTASCVVDV